MSALMKAATRLMANQAARPSTTRAFASSTYVPKQKTTAQIWLGDAGAYPVIGVLGAACILAGSFITMKMLYNPDIRVFPDKRRADIRTWH